MSPKTRVKESRQHTSEESARTRSLSRELCPPDKHTDAASKAFSESSKQTTEKSSGVQSILLMNGSQKMDSHRESYDIQITIEEPEAKEEPPLVKISLPEKRKAVLDSDTSDADPDTSPSQVPRKQPTQRRKAVPDSGASDTDPNTSPSPVTRKQPAQNKRSGRTLSVPCKSSKKTPKMSSGVQSSVLMDDSQKMNFVTDLYDIEITIEEPEASSQAQSSMSESPVTVFLPLPVSVENIKVEEVVEEEMSSDDLENILETAVPPQPTRKRRAQRRPSADARLEKYRATSETHEESYYTSFAPVSSCDGSKLIGKSSSGAPILACRGRPSDVKITIEEPENISSVQPPLIEFPKLELNENGDFKEAIIEPTSTSWSARKHRARVRGRAGTKHKKKLTRADMYNEAESPDMPGENVRRRVHPLPEGGMPGDGQFLDPFTLFKLMLHEEPSGNTVPYGVKENVFFLLDNSENVLRQAQGKRSLYIDDCGAWHSKSSLKTHYYIIDKNNLDYVDVKDGLYCKYVKNRRVPMDPQPLDRDIVVFKKYYVSLKRDQNYRKRVTTVKHCPSSMDYIKQLAVIEYIGVYPQCSAPHGNARLAPVEYVRSSAIVKARLEQMTPFMTPREVYDQMMQEGGLCAPRDLKQVQNAKHIAKCKMGEIKPRKKRRLTADGMQTLLDQLNGHPFMREVIEFKDEPPSVTLYTDDQLKDINQFCNADSAHPSVLGIDRTINLGPCYLTILVYHNNNLIRRHARCYPVMLGPIFLHWDSTFLGYHCFFSHLQGVLQDGIGRVQLCGENLTAGSAEEQVIMKALSSCFPSSQQVFCLRHVEKSVQQYLCEKMNVSNKAKDDIFSALFGGDGLSSCDTLEQFEVKCQEVKDSLLQYSEHESYFGRIIENIQQHIFSSASDDEWIPFDWNNNPCDGMNSILKFSEYSKVHKLPKIINSLHRIVKEQFLDVRRALYGRGSFSLAPWVSHYYIRPAMWALKSEEERNSLFKRFMNVVLHKNCTTSTKEKCLTVSESTKCSNSRTKEKCKHHHNNKAAVDRD